jgi:hypoxanthine-guanine phosphoribosyltransferase
MHEDAPGLEDLDDGVGRVDALLVEEVVDEGHGIGAA